MKSLKDYFSSPKSSDVSLNDSVSVKPESPVEMGLPSKRKNKKSLSNKNSKRKKLDSSIRSVNTSQNTSITLDESIEEFDVIKPKSSKKRRKKNEDSKAGKPLSLKKRKSVKSDENLEVNKNLDQLSTNNLNELKNRSISIENSIDNSTDALPLKDTNHGQLSPLIKSNLFDKVKDKSNEKSIKCKNNSVLVKDKNTDLLSSSIKDRFFVISKDKTDKIDEKSVKNDNNIVLDKNINTDLLSSSIRDKFLTDFKDKSGKLNEGSAKKTSEAASEKLEAILNKDNELSLIKGKNTESESGNKRIKSKNKTSLKKAKGNKKKIDDREFDKEPQHEQESKDVLNDDSKITNVEVKLSEIKDSANNTKDEVCLDVNDDYNKKTNLNESSMTEESAAQESYKNIKTSVNSGKKKRNSKGVVDRCLVADEIPSGSKRKRKRKSDDLSDDIKADNSVQNGEVPAPEMRRSLLNYFNKVDKSAVVSVSEEKKTIKVEAMVHEPRSTERSTKKPLVKKKIRKCRKQPDFDLITSEEDCSFVDETPWLAVTPKRPAWQMRINLNSPSLNDTVTLDEESNTGSEIALDSECSTPLPKEDSDIIILDEDSVADVEIVSTGQVSKPASLKGAGNFAAYFGVKSASKKDKKPEERSVATKLFLQSPAPPIIKKIIQQTASDVVEGIPAPFPVHSHVRQKDTLSSMWNLPRCELNLKSSVEDVPFPSIPQFTSLCDLNEEEASLDRITTNSTKTEINNATKQLKEKESNLPIKKWLEGLRGMKKKATVCELWNDKYRPKSTEEVLVERNNVCSLSDWLKTFQSNQANGSDTESSGDEFINDKSEKVVKYGNTALLVGPPGVGKTAAVYAAAKQNGYQVLELNASCNRNGKKVHLEFSEATQSHKVETKSLFKSKSKKKDKNKQSNKKSLILIEDSDLIFNDLDEGYVNCLSLLQSSSKRPLVLVANDANCKHLMKLLPSRSTISLTFQRPCPHVLSCFLKSMSLVEGNVMPQEACDLLVESTEGDLRKAIVNLQFYGPLYKQLDRRKLSLLNESLSSFKDCSFETKDEAQETIRRAKTLSTFDMLSSKKVSSRFSWFRESTTVEPRLDDTLVDSLRNDIADNLISSITTFHQPFSSYCDTLSAGDKLSDVVDSSVCLSRRAVACDYLSSLRHIARTERIRLSVQTKRNKRYFNHLHNLGVETSDQRMLDNLCSTFDGDSELKYKTPPDFDDIQINY